MPMSSAASLHARGHVGVEREHDLRRAVDHRDVHPARDERLGHLEADVAGADDDRARAAALERRAQPLAGVDRPRRLDRLGAGDRRGLRLGAGRDDELVERLDRLAAVARCGPSACARARSIAMTSQPVRTSMPRLRCSCGVAADEPLRVLDEPADVVRDPARRVRGVRPALERDDLEVGVAAARDARGAHPGGVAADDREPLRHVAQPSRESGSKRSPGERLNHCRAA